MFAIHPASRPQSSHQATPRVPPATDYLVPSGTLERQREAIRTMRRSLSEHTWFSFQTTASIRDILVDLNFFAFVDGVAPNRAVRHYGACFAGGGPEAVALKHAPALRGRCREELARHGAGAYYRCKADHPELAGLLRLLKSYAKGYDPYAENDASGDFFDTYVKQAFAAFAIAGFDGFLKACAAYGPQDHAGRLFAVEFKYGGAKFRQENTPRAPRVLQGDTFERQSIRPQLRIGQSASEGHALPHPAVSVRTTPRNTRPQAADYFDADIFSDTSDDEADNATVARMLLPPSA